MKKRFLGLFLMLCTLPFLEVKAQEFSPFMSSPYAGVTAGQINPASLAGTKYKFDITLFGGSAGVHNDWGIWSRKKQLFNINFYNDMWSHRSDFRNGNLPQDARDDIKHYLRSTGSNWDQDKYGGLLSAQMDIAHIMYSFSDRFSLAAGYSQKALAKVEDLPMNVGAAAVGAYVAGAPNRPIGSATYGSSSTFLALYNQISVTGAYTFIDNEMHKLKGGLTAKFLFGGKTGFAYADGMTVNYNTGNVNLKPNSEAGKSTKSNLGFGGDIGLEYEYQPAELKGNQIAEYRLKVGASLLDVGRFKATETDYRSLTSGSGVPNGFNDLFRRYASGAQKGDYTMSLPMMFTAQIDYNFGNGLFLNFTPYIAMNQNSPHKMSKFNSYNLIPHYELKNFGVSVPMQYDQYGKFTAGLGLRAWRHVWVGSNTIIKNLWPGDNKNYAADFHVMVKIPIMKGENDRDGDGVPDKLDKCPDVPGLKKFQGCPDTDGDGIPDNEDKCPNEAGPASTQGCPDRDGDGVIDSEDRCPDQAGTAALQGCPDRDGDGVADIDDACPDQAGPKATKGCPDRDGDGVADKDDRCPDQAGPAALQGCPDRDGDGIPDIDDKCPDVAGTKDNQGCPVVAAPSNITTVEFEVNKFNIQSQYNAALDLIVKTMAENPGAVVNIVGHTDNTYLRSFNMNLSKKRAEAVKNYFVKKKVAAKRITTQYYGPDKPIADNNTAEGRQKNRRSEITIVIK